MGFGPNPHIKHYYLNILTINNLNNIYKINYFSMSKIHKRKKIFII